MVSDHGNENLGVKKPDDEKDGVFTHLDNSGVGLAAFAELFQRESIVVILVHLGKTGGGN